MVLPQKLEEAAQELSRRARARLLADTRITPQEKAAAAPEAAAPAFVPRPGVERWPVKTGADPDAEQVDQTPVASTVETLLLIPRPADMPLTLSSPQYQAHRAPPELAVYTVEATLTDYREEIDGDYHLVLESDNGYEMIAEIPDPDFVDDASPFKPQITAARAAFDAQFAVTENFQMASLRVSITGVAFFDTSHGQRGVAPSNAIELHPVLAVQAAAAAPPAGST
ncbi:MAG TPA: hypothetical protein VGS41_14130 [Chthonomonadales bacterium]|nr:hypothetical protein [Chthonomonadales bacterium]